MGESLSQNDDYMNGGVLVVEAGDVHASGSLNYESYKEVIFHLDDYDWLWKGNEAAP